jgi:hypothetical protein
MALATSSCSLGRRDQQFGTVSEYPQRGRFWRAPPIAVSSPSARFHPDSPLRRLGDINFYIDSDRYGFVEIAHLIICHAILDFVCGLREIDGTSPTAAEGIRITLGGQG